MERNYKITIITTEGVIKRYFYKREIALGTIMQFKERFDDFLIGVLSEKIKGKWKAKCSIKK
jgi:hypothetical protein